MSKSSGFLATTEQRVKFAYTLPLALAACGQPETMVVTPPATLLTCSDEPAVPSLPGKELQDERDRLTLDYILALRSAWGDCRAKVDGTRAWVAEMAD